MVRKSELTDATWDEVNFTDATWTIPKARMKRRSPHRVYLSNQVMDILVALKTFAGGSHYVLPSRPLSRHLKKVASAAGSGSPGCRPGQLLRG